MVNRLPSGFSVKSTYRGLKKAWIGFKVAKRKGDHDKMVYYAEGILKFQKQLGVPVSGFSDLGMIELSSNTKEADRNNTLHN